MSTETLVKFCAPTLAGIKVSSLFTYKFTCEKKLMEDVDSKNKLLNCKGLYFKILRIKNSIALIYVYRKKQLEKILENNENIIFLQEHGYDKLEISNVLAVLSQHMKNEEFPHEIGVFLGYPLDDIKAFIKNKGKNEKYVGYWKAYTNAEYARKVSEKYRKCTNVYCKMFEKGTKITKLTIAC